METSVRRAVPHFGSVFRIESADVAPAAEAFEACRLFVPFSLVVPPFFERSSSQENQTSPLEARRRGRRSRVARSLLGRDAVRSRANARSNGRGRGRARRAAARSRRSGGGGATEARRRGSRRGRRRPCPRRFGPPPRGRTARRALAMTMSSPSALTLKGRGPSITRSYALSKTSALCGADGSAGRSRSRRSPARAAASRGRRRDGRRRRSWP